MIRNTDLKYTEYVTRRTDMIAEITYTVTSGKKEIRKKFMERRHGRAMTIRGNGAEDRDIIRWLMAI